MMQIPAWGFYALATGLLLLAFFRTSVYGQSNTTCPNYDAFPGS